MKIFITGATGYIGGVVAEKLRDSGHSVVALARSAESIMTLENLGIETVRGDLADLPILTAAARAADGVSMPPSSRRDMTSSHRSLPRRRLFAR